MESASAQADTLGQATGLQKNAVLLSVAASPHLYGILGLMHYEHVLMQDKDGPSKSLSLRAGAGRWVGGDGGGFTTEAGLTGLTGNGAHHFEVVATCMLLFNHDYYQHHMGDYEYDKDEYEQFPEDFNGPPTKPTIREFLFLKPEFSVGYRYHKPGGDFIFRTGMGFPGLFHLGIGLSL